jgi:hypothetical protein
MMRKRYRRRLNANPALQLRSTRPTRHQHRTTMIRLKAPPWLVADDKVDKVPAGQSDAIAEAPSSEPPEVDAPTSTDNKVHLLGTLTRRKTYWILGAVKLAKSVESRPICLDSITSPSFSVTTCNACICSILRVLASWVAYFDLGLIEAVRV